MTEHPIQGLMKTTMESIKEMVDVNTIVGEPVESSDGQVIIPISKVSFGFASGGTEFNGKSKGNKGEGMTASDNSLPFGGGTGAGVSIMPVAFIVVGNGSMKLLPVDQNANMLNSIIDTIPKIATGIQNKLKSKESNVKNENSCDNN
ncbi:sporulation protein YtfJ [Proteiniborus ethanoligenes]|uniref:Sporulation protein YtfJ n=1 Tax=Proteiniborus ethanoligenes TaxID=415015 RepID=A0A1H3KCE1_9FIRM|nr:GerW family sporulation protein [Proteiniborus ethanoligenes]SDY49385.1 sporulation protein YtfJ [Proteiniborus ethanoligenes]